MGMHSPELLLLVENCPKGAETLVTRIIHILTDKSKFMSKKILSGRTLYAGLCDFKNVCKLDFNPNCCLISQMHLHQTWLRE